VAIHTDVDEYQICDPQRPRGDPRYKYRQSMLGDRNRKPEKLSARIHRRRVQKWIRTDEWKRLAPANRNRIWSEAWIKRIEPVFGDCAPDTVTMEALWA
jgi:hypothetical protein